MSIELEKIRDVERRIVTLAAVQEAVTHWIDLSDADWARAAALELHGIDLADALHVAGAESSGCEAFVTTDDRLLTRLGSNMTSLRVINPIQFIQQLERL